MDQRKTVLLADAGEEFRTLLWEEMEKTGEFSVEIARDGNEILKRVKERMPDLLVMDVMLPGMDGISVLRQLQKQGDAPMTILVSGFVSDRMLAEASELGAAYFLPKPFETATLLDKMRGLFLKAPQESLPSLKTMVTSVIHEIAAHADLKDEGQTVKITPPTPDNPQTGDNSNLGFWIGLGAVALGGIIAVVIIRVKSRNDEDDE